LKKTKYKSSYIKRNMPPKKKKVKAPTQFDALTIVYGSKSDTDTRAWLETSGLNKLKTYPNFKDMDGHSLLTLAASQGKLETIKYLLEKGAKIDYKQPNGYDALAIALVLGNFEVAIYLISKGLTLQGVKDTKIKLLKGEQIGSEKLGQESLMASIKLFESTQPTAVKPTAVKPTVVKPTVVKPIMVNPDLIERLLQMTPEMSESPPSITRSDSESSDTSHISESNLSRNSSMGSLRYSPSPSLFSQLSDDTPIFLLPPKPRASLQTVMDRLFSS
jgi:ankyrin repeat protein